MMEYNFSNLCLYLPDDVAWREELTPDIAHHIASAAIDDHRKEIEREAMIRCVKLIGQQADETFQKMAEHAQDDDDLVHEKAEAFTTMTAAHLILKELGMTFPECKHWSNDG